MRDLRRRLRRSQRGDSIRIVAGEDPYPEQAIPSGTKAVTFAGDGGSPQMAGLEVAASDVTVRDVVIEDRGSGASACTDYHHAILRICGEDQTFDGVIVDGLDNAGTLGTCPRDGIESGPDVIDGLTFSNGEVRDIHDAVGVRLGGSGITFSGNRFHGLEENGVCTAESEHVVHAAGGGARLRARQQQLHRLPGPRA